MITIMKPTHGKLTEFATNTHFLFISLQVKTVSKFYSNNLFIKIDMRSIETY